MTGGTAAGRPVAAAKASAPLDALAWTVAGVVICAGVYRAAGTVAPTFGRLAADIGAEWPELLGSLAGCLATLVFVELLGRFHALPSLILRKAAHLSGALIMFFGGWFFQSHWPVFAFAVLATMLLAAGPRLGLLRPLHGPERHDYGDVVFPLGLYLAFVLGQGSPVAYQVAVLTLGISDVAAAAIGVTYGRPNWWVAGGWRSFAGSSAFAFTALLFVLGSLVVGGFPLTIVAVLAAVLVAAALTLTEAIAPLGLDNVTVPVAACFLMQVVTHGI